MFKWKERIKYDLKHLKNFGKFRSQSILIIIKVEKNLNKKCNLMIFKGTNKNN
jgi:hypothetical protein